MLNDARMGELKPEGIQAFYETMTWIDPFLSMTGSSLCSYQVKRANDRKLAALPTEPQLSVAQDRPGLDHKHNIISLEDATKKLDKNCPAPASITLKVGCQVMLIMTVEQGVLVNGSMGVVKDFLTSPDAIKSGYSIPHLQEPKAEVNPRDIALQRDRIHRKKVEEAMIASQRWPLVEFHNGMTVLMEPIRISIVNVFGEVEAVRWQVPLILAWALSIHKSQGQTLQKVKVDLSETFEKGQAYVALSRVTTLEGLWVTGFEPAKVMAHPRVIEWSKTLQTGRHEGPLLLFPLS